MYINIKIMDIYIYIKHESRNKTSDRNRGK